MRWLLAGLAFALAVGLAIATAAIRADNIRTRARLERGYTGARDREIELWRLQVLAAEKASPEQLAARLRAQIADYRRLQAAEAAP